MSLFTLLRFLTPNATVLVSEAAGDLSTTAALGQAIENLDTYGTRLNGSNAGTSAFTLDASLAAATTGLKVPVGAGAVPTAQGAVAFDSTALGLTFGDGTNTVAMSGRKRLADTTLSVAATNITFSGIPGTYKHLVVEIYSRGDGAVAVESVKAQFNGDTGANYDRSAVSSAGGVVAQAALAGQTSVNVGTQPGASAARAALFGVNTLKINNYAGTTGEKAIAAFGGFADSTTANSEIDMYTGNWRNTAAITSIKLFPTTSTNFVAGTRVSVYLDN